MRCVIGILCAVLVNGIPTTIAVAQNSSGLATYDFATGRLQYAPELKSMPLTIRPRDMVLGTRTPQAGDYHLDSLREYVVHVPETCVGTRRCPLVLFLHPAATSWHEVLQWWGPVADKYGMILLAPNSRDDWQLDQEQTDWANVDAALKTVLGTFAIDTARIALIGNSASGGATAAFGGYRLDLFSRIVFASSDFSATNIDPHNQTTRFLVAGGVTEARSIFTEARALRRDGHPVDEVVGFKGHGSKPEDWDFIGRWLQESWAPAPSAAGPGSTTVTDSMPLLTAASVTGMLTFWKPTRSCARDS